jgi:beta-N-acetylhexosaminidase
MPLVASARGEYNVCVRYLLRILLALGLLLPASALQAGGASARAPDQTDAVAALMAQMSPAELVGQLFLAAFYGPSAGDGTDIQKLVTQYHVGGVILLGANDNYTDTVAAPGQVVSLTRQLQTDAITAWFPHTLSAGDGSLPGFVPLLIALPQSEDGYRPAGLLGLPSPMTVGATWDTAQAEALGTVAGQQLAAMGVNLLLGPNLDIVQAPAASGSWDMGTQVFGGSGYWVGTLGQAFVRGVHEGGSGQVAVAPGHFPGQGGSDRNPDREITTLNRSLDALRSADLVPFLAVTHASSDATTQADALLTTDVRYQGLQSAGQSTPPLSLDQKALAQLLALPELTPWRANGGVTVSGPLGAPAIKQFYTAYQHRLVARDAFLAGNDLLALVDFGITPRAEQTSNTVDTLAYFAQRYAADQTFAAQVNAAVTRILTLKLRLYVGQITPARVMAPLGGLPAPASDKMLALSQSAATLIAGDIAAPPAPGDRIVFFTDARTSPLCASCAPAPLLDKKAFERSVSQLYGPAGSGQMLDARVQSFSFDELAAYLAGPAPSAAAGAGTPTPSPSPIDTALGQANWLVFSMLNVTPAVPSSGLVSAFLSQRPDLARGKRIVVFAFDAPYYLDATDLSNVSAAYVLYNASSASVTTAARLLFHELVPRGQPPVSVRSMGYDLNTVTTADPARGFDLNGPPVNPTAPLKVGDIVEVRTSVIPDRNNHPVPDGTLVRFSVYYPGVEFPAIYDTPTTGGIAQVNLTVPTNRAGQVEVSASSGPAQAHSRMAISVQQNQQIIFVTVVPTSQPPPPPPTASPTPTSTPAPTATLSPTATPTPPPAVPASWPNFLGLCLVLAAVVVGGYLVPAARADPQQRLRLALSGAIGALVGYNVFALGAPGILWVFLLVGAAAGLGVGWFGFVVRGWGRAR